MLFVALAAAVIVGLSHWADSRAREPALVAVRVRDRSER